MHPNLNASELVYTFFIFCTEWNWSVPIKFYNDYPQESIKIQCSAMSIIAMDKLNCAHNVTPDNRRIILEAFKLGKQAMDLILFDDKSWSTLFAKPQFYGKYKHYVMISALCYLKDKKNMWSSLVESKIRLLLQSMSNRKEFTKIHLNPVSIKNELWNTNGTEYWTTWFIGVEIRDNNCTAIHIPKDYFINEIYRVLVGLLYFF